VKSNGHARYYDKLTPEERFRLDVLAMARGDKEESELLVRSCPRLQYTMNHRGFTGRWLGAMDITLRTYLEVAGYLDRIKAMEMVRVIIPYSETFAQDTALDTYLDGHRAGARQAWREAGKKGEAPEWPLEGVDEEGISSRVKAATSILPEVLEQLERNQATHALTLWRGFAAFCEESIAVEAGTVLKVVLGNLEGVKRIEELEDLAERLDLAPDAETVEEIREGLAESWRVVERAG
jgi:hypothetical protein